MSQTVVIGRAAESFVIEGGRPLYGRIQAAGNKNGALPILAACLLTTESVVLHNVPRIVDVETMIELLNDVGAEAEWTGANEVHLRAAEITKQELDEELCSRMRASFLLTGPLLARVGHVSAPPPGGDVIGRRRLDPHIHAFAELGAQIDIGRRYELRGGSLRGKHIFLDEASVMATENAVMAATLTPGETVIGNAACEPHVQDLCRFLVSLGAQIEGIESNVLRIHGVETLGGGEWEIGPDHIEVGSFIGLAAITGGDVTIDGVKQADLVSLLHGFDKLGVRVELGDDNVRVPPRQELVVQDDLGGHVPKIEDGPWPAFPSDLTSVALTVATQAHGTILMFEKMFENRLFFTDKLVSMGARIILCDPHRAVVTGPSKLRGQRMESPDIRAGMAMLLASLCAEGPSTIGAVHQIDKGYERIDERLRALGAQIERAES
jgi:UDP-N-acetylglucosamine 1-carboxyvinyltransferase